MEVSIDNQIDMKLTKAGKFILEDSNYNFLNINEINKSCFIKFLNCNISIAENFSSRTTPRNYIFNKCNIIVKTITLYLDDGVDNLLNMLYNNEISCNELRIWYKNFNAMTREQFLYIMKIKAKNIVFIIGDKVKRQNLTNSLFKIAQKEATTIYCYNINFPKIFSLDPKKVILFNCSGFLQNLKGLINIHGGKTPNLNVSPNTVIYAEEFDSLRVECEDRFNIFLKNPNDFKKVDYLGIIDNTNCNSLRKYESKIYKFKVFINVDFTNNDFIQQFFNCKFFNCYFNENQMIMNSFVKKCFITKGDFNFVDSIITK